LNITKDAHNASVSGAAGAIASAINIAHAKWLASGQPVSVPPIAGIDFTNSGHADVGFNVEGWPDAASDKVDISTENVLGNGGKDNEICALIMKNLLSSSSVTFGSGDDCNEQYCSVYKAPECIYTYQQNKDVARKIIYSTTSGIVSKKLPTH
ncbi:MAG TPA: hypothetical protein PLD88_03895, partial [Candidatus Berkiella sp.]|nr:hypothetical protein [Candidatus Berkiella sp.]